MIHPQELPEALQPDDSRPATVWEIARFLTAVVALCLAVAGAVIGVVDLIGRWV